MIRNLEKRFGHLAVPNLTVFLIAGQVIATMMAVNNPELFERMFLIPAKVIDGEVFRLLTFLVMPPGGFSLLTLFYWYMLYLMGTALEHFWGTFQYNLFLLIGGLATIAAAFATPDQIATNGFIQGTVFLAFAFLNPNFVIHLFFILPVRIKWFAIFTWITYGWMFLNGTWSIRLSVAASALNFFLFFGQEIWLRVSSGQRHMMRQALQFAEKPPEYLHKCEVCGITDSTHPGEEFRYCSRCVGDVAFCETHLRDHTHIVNVQDES